MGKIKPEKNLEHRYVEVERKKKENLWKWKNKTEGDGWEGDAEEGERMAEAGMKAVEE